MTKFATLRIENVGCMAIIKSKINKFGHNMFSHSIVANLIAVGSANDDDMQ